MSPIVTPLPQVPPITDYNMDGHTYRYYHGDPLYPFGYGLSYSKFLYSNLVVSDTVVAGQDAVVMVTVTATGPYTDAEEVREWYFTFWFYSIKWFGLNSTSVIKINPLFVVYTLLQLVVLFHC